MSDSDHIENKVAAQAFKVIQGSKNGQVFTKWLFQELGVGERVFNSDPRKQDRNVALHDFAVELHKMLK